MMNSTEINFVLGRDQFSKSQYLGTYAEDNLPRDRNLTKPFALVANTASRRSSGEHWIAIFVNSKGEGIFFDSYGFPPRFYSTKFENFLDKNTEIWHCNPMDLQSPISNVCGHYACYAILNLCRGVTLSQLISLFTAGDYTFNDTFVASKIVNSFGLQSSKVSMNMFDK